MINIVTTVFFFPICLADRVKFNSSNSTGIRWVTQGDERVCACERTYNIPYVHSNFRCGMKSLTQKTGEEPLIEYGNGNTRIYSNGTGNPSALRIHNRWRESNPNVPAVIQAEAGIRRDWWRWEHVDRGGCCRSTSKKYGSQILYAWLLLIVPRSMNPLAFRIPHSAFRSQSTIQLWCLFACFALYACLWAFNTWKMSKYDMFLRLTMMRQLPFEWVRLNLLPLRYCQPCQTTLFKLMKQKCGERCERL